MKGFFRKMGAPDKGGGANKRSSSGSGKKAAAAAATTNGSSSATQPGASSVDGGTSVFRVMVPEGVEPGQEFQVYAGNRIVRVRCPPNSMPGQSLQITVPTDAPQQQQQQAAGRGAGQLPDSPNVQRIEGSDPPAYMVTITEGVQGGAQFPVTISGQQLMVTCPPNATPGMKVRVVPPPPARDVTAPPEQSPSTAASAAAAAAAASNNNNNPRSSTSSSSSSKKDDGTQLFEVQVPAGVQPGQPFALLANGVRVLVTCPVNAGPGQRIRFKLPLALTQAAAKRSAPIENEAINVKLSYDKDGWMRTIRVADMKFQWVRMDDKGEVDLRSSRFDASKSAYVRKLQFRPGTDSRIRNGELSLVPASQAAVDSRIRGSAEGDKDLVTYADIAEAQVQTFEAKAQWFQEKCQLLAVEWNEGHMRMNVRREYLLEDSVDAVMSLSRKDLRKLWRFEFIGEMGIDAGGLAREWFQLVTSQAFDPDLGLWKSSATNQMCMEINPAAKFIFDDYLVYYRFLGRVMGKAMFDRQLVVGHMVQYIYKHILGWPMTFKDLKSLDEEYYNNLLQLQQLAEAGEDLEMLCLDFTTTQEIMGAKEQVELIENGQDTEVSNDNFPEYLEACLKYRMLNLVKPQLCELLLGFFDVIPEPLLTVFDFQELELLMCGLPQIDMDDWMAHTEYSGDYEQVGADYPVCQWFWQVVSEFDQEMKARLLQFVTGTSGVPSRGFGVLQGNDGNIRKFTIHGVSVDVCLYPRAHTCFNRIDLPLYETQEELRDKLKLAVTMVATGFDIE